MKFSKNHLLVALALIGLSLGAFYYYNNQSIPENNVVIQQNPKAKISIPTNGHKHNRPPDSRCTRNLDKRCDQDAYAIYMKNYEYNKVNLPQYAHYRTFEDFVSLREQDRKTPTKTRR